jgi:anti-anti-sigma regulatory factor
MEKSTLAFIKTEIQPQGRVMIIRPQGKLDYFTYLDLIAKGREVYQGGYKDLILDMSDISEVGISGLFALCSVALLFQDQEPASPEEGWTGLHVMVNYLRQHLSEHFKLLGPRPEIEKVLVQTGLPIYPNLSTALTSFSSEALSRN